MKYAITSALIYFCGLIPCIWVISRAPSVFVSLPFVALVILWARILPKIYPPPKL